VRNLRFCLSFSHPIFSWDNSTTFHDFLNDFLVEKTFLCLQCFVEICSHVMPVTNDGSDLLRHAWQSEASEALCWNGRLLTPDQVCEAVQLVQHQCIMSNGMKRVLHWLASRPSQSGLFCSATYGGSAAPCTTVRHALLWPPHAIPLSDPRRPDWTARSSPQFPVTVHVVILQLVCKICSLRYVCTV